MSHYIVLCQQGILKVLLRFICDVQLAEINEFDRTYFKPPGQSYNGSTYDPAYAFQKTNNSTSCPNGAWPRSQYTGPGGWMYPGPGSYCTNRPSLRMLKQIGYY